MQGFLLSSRQLNRLDIGQVVYDIPTSKSIAICSKEPFRGKIHKGSRIIHNVRGIHKPHSHLRGEGGKKKVSEKPRQLFEK